jgi:CspA family cold shock protein
VPTGKVKWYDAEKGFGFIDADEGEDVFLHAGALPADTTTIKNGTRVEYGMAQGRRGVQAMNVTILEPPVSIAANRRERDRKPTEDMVVIVEDVIKLLDNVSTSLRRGHYPDKSVAANVAQVLRAVAADLEH